MTEGVVTKFYNCRILRDSKIIWDDLFVQNGQIINPFYRFFQLQKKADVQVDCKGCILSPGYIDVQLNGGFGVDFTTPNDVVNGSIQKVAKGILKYGCTSFCPTIITSKPETYKQLLPHIRPTKGTKDGAEVIGTHLEGPFISSLKYGAHQKDFVIKEVKDGINTILDVYGTLEGVKIITLAPELPGIDSAIQELAKRDIIVSIGHTMASIAQAQHAVTLGCKLITHLFNAMVPFHHRDPGVVGLLGSRNHKIHYSMIVDDVHSHSSCVRIAYDAHPKGFVLITDSITAMGLPEGVHSFGPLTVEIKDRKAYVSGTDTLAGSIITMDAAVRTFKENTNCSIVEAIETATLHPARMLGIEKRKGTLNFGADADFLMLDDDLNVLSTYVNGELAWTKQ